MTPRRAACGHRPARQSPNSAAAARMASAVISGWPDAPDWPLHSRAPAGAAAGAGTELAAGGWNNRVSQLSELSCARAGPAKAAARRSAAARRRIGAEMGMACGLDGGRWRRLVVEGMGNLLCYRTINLQFVGVRLRKLASGMDSHNSNTMRLSDDRGFRPRPAPMQHHPRSWHEHRDPAWSCLQPTAERVTNALPPVPRPVAAPRRNEESGENRLMKSS